MWFCHGGHSGRLAFPVNLPSHDRQVQYHRESQAFCCIEANHPLPLTGSRVPTAVPQPPVIPETRSTAEGPTRASSTISIISRAWGSRLQVILTTVPSYWRRTLTMMLDLDLTCHTATGGYHGVRGSVPRILADRPLWIQH